MFIPKMLAISVSGRRMTLTTVRSWSRYCCRCEMIDSSEKIWDTLDNYKEVVEALEHTNESLIADRQNRVLRILTVMSATLLPLTFVTGLFGMNVEVPWEGQHVGFWVVTGFLAALLGGLLLVFRWAKWL